MLWWTLFFLIGAIAAAIIGFGEFAAGYNRIAKIFFWIFLVLFVVSIIFYTYTIPTTPSTYVTTNVNWLAIPL